MKNEIGSGIFGIYVDDVEKLIAGDCTILREATVLGVNCKWIIISGSPCQDLTYAGPHSGYFGLIGQRRVYFFTAQHTIW